MHLAQWASATAIFEAVVQIANALHLVTTVEGGETEGQRECLLAIRCIELEGFLLLERISGARLQASIYENSPPHTWGVETSRGGGRALSQHPPWTTNLYSNAAARDFQFVRRVSIATAVRK
jgi:hypothetical protein